MRAKWIMIVAIATMMTACGEDNVVGSDNTIALITVKNGHFTSHPAPAVNIGDAVNCFFGDPKWSTLTGEDGNTYVNLTGRITYLDEPVNALVQFRIDGTSFEMNAFEMNDIPQNDLTKLALIEGSAVERRTTDSTNQTGQSVQFETDESVHF